MAAKLRTFSCTPNKTLKPLPSVAGTLTCGLTHFVRILAHMLAPLSLKLAAKEVDLAIDRDAWIFGLAVAAIAVLFSLTSLAKQGSIAAYFLVFFMCGIPAGVGFFIGQRSHKKSLKIQHILVAAFITYFITDNSVKLIGLNQEYWYLTFAILFVLSGLVSWRSPKMFNKNGS